MYEYKKEKTFDSLATIEQLNQTGQEGWELCAVTSIEENEYIYFFKRKIKQ